MHSSPWPSVLPKGEKRLHLNSHVIRMRGIEPRPALIFLCVDCQILGQCTIHHIRYIYLEVSLLSAGLSGIHYLTRPLNLINRKINIEPTRRPSYPPLDLNEKYTHSAPWASVLPKKKKGIRRDIIRMRGIEPRPALGYFFCIDFPRF
jgi:hypothetical protein